MEGLTLPPGVVLAPNPRSRRLTLRLDEKRARVVLSAPHSADLDKVSAFLDLNAAWIDRRLSAVPPATPFVAGEMLELFGVPWTTPDGGAAAVRRAIRVVAQKWFEDETTRLCKRIKRAVKEVRLFDNKTAWGLAEGSSDYPTLSYSWRLALAPVEIAKYLAAHEVAHCIQRNHCTPFWTLCGELSPIAPKEAKEWLRVNGLRLRRWGEADS